MADASPRSYSSTDGDTDEKALGFHNSQGIVVSDASDKSRDQKTLRRLAQNREAARKSRLRKKAYVQQLESSRMKLTQLEQELQRARQQGIFISSSGDQSQSMSGNVSGRNMDDQELMARLVAKKQAKKDEKARLKKRKNVGPSQSETGADDVEKPRSEPEPSARNLEKTPIVVDSDAEPPVKRHNPGPTIPELLASQSKPITTADKGLVNFGRSATENFPSHSEMNRLMKTRSVFQGEQTVAFLTQALAWSKSTSASMVLDEINIKKLEEAADKAADRATEMQNRWSKADEELERVKKQLEDSKQTIRTLRQDVSDRDERLTAADFKLEEAAEQVADARTTYYGRGMNRRLEMAVEAGLDYKKILLPIDDDIWDPNYGKDVSDGEEEEENPAEKADENQVPPS